MLPESLQQSVRKLPVSCGWPDVSGSIATITLCRTLTICRSNKLKLPEVPSGHGCRCLGDNCNPSICDAANTHDPPSASEGNQSVNLSRQELVLKFYFLVGSPKTEGESCTAKCCTVNCQSCVFPFKYNGVEYNECTTQDSDNGAPWCAVDVSTTATVR